MKCTKAALILVTASTADAFVQPSALFKSKTPLASCTSKPTTPVLHKSILFGKADETGDDDEEPINPYADPNYPEVSKSIFITIPNVKRVPHLIFRDKCTKARVH